MTTLSGAQNNNDTFDTAIAIDGADADGRSTATT